MPFRQDRRHDHTFPMARLATRLMSRFLPAHSRFCSFPRRRFHLSVVTSKEEMDELKANPFFEKYADKIAKLQKTSPEEFLSRLAKAEDERRRKHEIEKTSSQGRDFSLPTRPKEGSPSETTRMMREKRLDDIVKLDLLQSKNAEEIGQIWREYHSTKDAVAAVIPSGTFAKMQTNFREFKTFLLPLPRKEGYEFVVVQFEGNEAHFTTLINYQAFKENAPECLTLVHYTELAETKGIVLMVGEYDKNTLSIQEAQCLASQVEMYYCNPTAEKLNLLTTFTYQPNTFKHADLISQLENLSLLTK